MKRFFILFILFSGLGTLSFAQTPPPAGAPKPKLKLGLGFTGTAFTGDLTPKGQGMAKFFPGANLSLQFINKKLVSPQFNAGFGKFIAQDRDLPPSEDVTPNTFVETSFFYVDFRLKAKFLREKKVNPFFSLGAGLLGYTPKDQSGNSLIENNLTREDGEIYGSMTATFPLSIGSEFKLNEILTLGLEATRRLTASDYLDNVGLLGPRKGKDKLTVFQISLFLTFDPESKQFQNLKARDRK